MDAARHLGTAPQGKRKAIAMMLEHTQISERRACRLVGLALYPETDLERLQVKVRFSQ